MLKKTKVVILSMTRKNTSWSNIYKNQHNKLGFDPKKKTRFDDRLAWYPQHLYILSDDEIKQGDWYYNPTLKTVNECEFISVIDESRYRKIIATTDESLGKVCKNCNGNGINELNYKPCLNCNGKKIFLLPQPSQQFIEKYVESYNKGEVITDVLVEYEIDKSGNCDCYYTKHCKSTQLSEGIKCKDTQEKTYKLKVDKSNFITIKKVKDSWNREEVIEIIRIVNSFSKETVEKWIKKNL